MIARYIILFMLFSLFGWIYESIFAVFKEGHWEKRGFLYGPICPIYGVGALAITLIVSYLPARYVASKWQIFVISFVGSFVLEFFTSYVLEKLFHAVWWDYSNLPLNLQGRSSLPSSLLFGMAGIFVVKVLSPWTQRMVAYIPPLPMEIGAFFLIALFSSDLTLTVSVLTNFVRYVEQAESSFHGRMQTIVENAKEKMEEAKAELPSLPDIKLPSFGYFSRMALNRVHSFRIPKVPRGKMVNLLNELRKGADHDH